MKGLLIVGHSHSDYQFIESTLYQQGMEKAKPSRRETLTPTAISRELLQTYDIDFENKTEVCQIDSGEIWNGLALDLLLGNKDQLFWGWADPQAVFLLNYWKRIGSQLKFLLVYDTPEAICSNIFRDKIITPQALEKEVEHWTSFYSELLHFYQHNQESCLLVHIEQIRENFSEFLSSTSELVGYSYASKERNGIISRPINKSRTEQLLIAELLKSSPTIYDSYEELQDVSDIPLAAKKTTGHVADNAVLLWNDRKEENKIQVRNGQVTNNLITQKDKEIGLLKEKNITLDNQYKNKKNILSQQEATLKILAKEKDSLSHQYDEKLKEADDESELLLLQLHQVQEELEHYFIKNQQAGKEISSLKDKENQLNKTLVKNKALHSEITKNGENVQQLTNENKLLLLQLHQVQEELESYFIKVKNVEKEKNNLSSQYDGRLKAIQEEQRKQLSVEKDENNLLCSKLHNIQHAQQEIEGYFTKNREIEQKLQQLEQQGVKQKFYYGAADRVKAHLSYRLGVVMMKHHRSFSGVLIMPIALLKEIRAFHQDRKQQKNEQLPPISQYQDIAEAEKIKQYLSYRVGYILAVKTRSIKDWVLLPLRLRQEVIAFQKRRNLQHS